MLQTLEHKTLADGSVLELVRYQLSEECAKQLERPANTWEMVLTCKTPIFGDITDPRASWYLQEQELKELYNAINSWIDFKNVRNFLKEEVAVSEQKFLEEKYREAA